LKTSFHHTALAYSVFSPQRSGGLFNEFCQYEVPVWMEDWLEANLFADKQDGSYYAGRSPRQNVFLSYNISCQLSVVKIFIHDNSWTFVIIYVKKINTIFSAFFKNRFSFRFTSDSRPKKTVRMANSSFLILHLTTPSAFM